MLQATASGKTVADKDGKWGTSWDGCMATLQETDTYIPPERGREHHFFPTTFGRGYVSSQDGNGWYMLVDQLRKGSSEVWWMLSPWFSRLHISQVFQGITMELEAQSHLFCHNRVVGNQWMPVIALHPMILWNWCSRYRTLVLWKAVICDHRSGDDTSCHSFHYKFRISRFVICSENFISIRVIWYTHIPFTTSCYDIFLLKDLHLRLPGNLICFIVDASKVTAPSGSPSSLHVKVRKFTWAALE